MAPRGGAKRSSVAEPQAFHQLGERGRKTGVQLKDTGARDEYGMQPIDDILSSPDKEPSGAARRFDDSDDEEDDDQGSEDMDIETSAGPGPRTLLKERSVQYPIPRSRSPLKTQLLSPAKRNPHLEHLSSPTRPPTAQEREPKVKRKLDFGAKSKGRATAPTNGLNGSFSDEDDADETEDAPELDNEESDDLDLLEASLRMVEDMGGRSSSPVPDNAPSPSPPPEDEVPAPQNAAAPKKGRGRPKAKPVAEEPPEDEQPAEDEHDDDDEPIAPRRGRPPKKAAPQPKQPAAPAPVPRKRRGDEADNDATEPDAAEDAPQTKRPRTSAAKPSKQAKATAPRPAPQNESKPRGRPGRKPKALAASGAGADAGETSFAALQRGPPMPKSRGLVSVRRDADEVLTTRSGRHSFRPLDYWRGDRVVQEELEFNDVSGRERFVLSTIKEVIRAPQEEPPAKQSASKSRGRPKAKSKRSQIPEVEPEDWELNPGVVNGEIILWEPEHALHPPADDEPVEVMEDRVAISGEAIQTRDTRDATFRFAKTLTMPFMAAGIVDLPPGAEKRPKNSRKMHMVFFVQYGKVQVTVNEASFRISAGGMWFVPRGKLLITVKYFIQPLPEMSVYEADRVQNGCVQAITTA
ncbi:hypothetical protein ACJ41O_002261 [Fusarium nematophilum]